MGQAATTTMRVRHDTRDRLNRLAKDDATSVPDFLDHLVEKEEQQRMLDAMNADFSQLRRDEPAWTEFKAETVQWDSSSADTAAHE